jgi:hypothetical protein
MNIKWIGEEEEEENDEKESDSSLLLMFNIHALIYWVTCTLSNLTNFPKISQLTN